MIFSSFWNEEILEWQEKQSLSFFPSFQGVRGMANKAQKWIKTCQNPQVESAELGLDSAHSENGNPALIYYSPDPHNSKWPDEASLLLVGEAGCSENFYYHNFDLKTFPLRISLKTSCNYLCSTDSWIVGVHECVCTQHRSTNNSINSESSSSREGVN